MSDIDKVIKALWHLLDIKGYPNLFFVSEVSDVSHLSEDIIISIGNNNKYLKYERVIFQYINEYESDDIDGTKILWPSHFICYELSLGSPIKTIDTPIK